MDLGSVSYTHLDVYKRQFLDKADGDQAQGFFFGRPVPASEVGANILADFRKRHPAPSSATAADGKLRLIKSSAKL